MKSIKTCVPGDIFIDAWDNNNLKLIIALSNNYVDHISITVTVLTEKGFIKSIIFYPHMNLLCLI